MDVALYFLAGVFGGGVIVLLWALWPNGGEED